MPSKGRREVIMSKVWSLFLWLVCHVCGYLFFSVLEKVINAGKAKMNRYITIEKFIDILNEEISPEHHVMVLAVLIISLHTDRFLINSSELVQMAAQYSPAFQKLPADRQAFISSVLSMPLFLIM
jgi:hypothetical protein